MTRSPRLISSWKPALAAVALAIAYVLLLPMLRYVLDSEDQPTLVELLLIVPLIVVIPVAVFMLAAWWCRRRRMSPLRRLLVSYLCASAAGAVLYVAADMSSRVDDGDPLHDSVIAAAILGAYNGVLVVGLWAVVYMMPEATRAEREREREREELRRAVEQARLRATLEPHFVLNTLNAIAGLVHEDPDQARERIGDLGDLLRDVVRLSQIALHPLDDEVRWLERYTRLLVARHAGRLDVRWDIDPASRSATVPVLVLQPLVENAIQHGALRRPGGGWIEIATRANERRLSCTVADNGPGFAGEPRADAQGLALTRRRLTAEWPDATLDVASGGDGTRVEIAWQRDRA